MRAWSLLLFLSVVTVPAGAVDPGGLEFHAQGGIASPVAAWSDVARFGAGGGLGVSAPLGEGFRVRGEVSFAYFVARDFEEGTMRAALAPALLLVQHRLAGTSFYLMAGPGLVYRWAEFEYEPPRFGVATTDDNGLRGGFAAGGGYALGAQLALEGRANLFMDSSSLSTQVVVTF